jgi:hypothetical protein
MQVAFYTSELKRGQNVTLPDHTINGGFHRARRHLSDEELEKYITSGQWRLRIIK